MGLKINLKLPKKLRELRVTLKPRDLLLATRIATGTATSSELTAKAISLATDALPHPVAEILTPLIGQKGNNMNTTPSWRKLTVTLITIVFALLQLWLQPSSMSPEHAATTIAGLLVTGIIALIFLLTQSKVDLAKLTTTTTGAALEQYVEQKLATVLTPVMEKMQTQGEEQQKKSKSVATEPQKTAEPVTIKLTPNPDGSFTLPDGTVLAKTS